MAADYRKQAAQLASQYGIPTPIFLSLIQHESAWNPSARSPAGAIGLAQLMPGTARGLGVDPYNPVENLTGGARYLADQYKQFGSWDLALAAYNAGPGAVRKYGGIPPYGETQRYVRNVMHNVGASPPPASSPLTRRPGGSPPSLPSSPVPEADPVEALTEVLYQRALRTLGVKSLDFGHERKPAVSRPAPPPGDDTATETPRRGLSGKVIGTPGAGTHTLGNWESDNAIDLAMPVGTPIYAPFTGTVGSQWGPLNSSSPRMAGLRMHLTGGGNELYYAHLSRLVVKPGQKVRAGDLLGYSGSANGVAHLHLGSRKGDPRRYIS